MSSPVSSVPSSTVSTTSGDSTKRSLRWRVVDIITAAVLGVACGLIFWVWNAVGGAWYKAVDAALPGLGGMATGIWVMGGVIGGLIIRKPGAAIFVEVVAATISALIGNQWGITTIYSGLAQGIGAEIIFALFAYRQWTLLVAALAGVGAEAVEWVYEYAAGNHEMSLSYNLIYFVSMAVSGVILAGVVSYALMRALASTGALDRFAAGRDARQQV